jgi:hypothetical protein
LADAARIRHHNLARVGESHRRGFSFAFGHAKVSGMATTAKKDTGREAELEAAIRKTTWTPF